MSTSHIARDKDGRPIVYLAAKPAREDLTAADAALTKAVRIWLAEDFDAPTIHDLVARKLEALG